MSGMSLDNVTGYADTILFSGFVYTMELDQPTVEAIAIRAGKIAVLGTSKEVRRLAGEKMQCIDLQGRMVMPGLIDGQCHPTKGDITNLFSCTFAFSATPEDIARILTEHLEKNSNAEFVMGGRWASSFFDVNEIPSPRLWLDQYSGDKAVYLRDDSGHNGWANTKMLQVEL